MFPLVVDNEQCMETCWVVWCISICCTDLFVSLRQKNAKHIPWNIIYINETKWKMILVCFSRRIILKTVSVQYMLKIVKGLSMNNKILLCIIYELTITNNMLRLQHEFYIFRITQLESVLRNQHNLYDHTSIVFLSFDSLQLTPEQIGTYIFPMDRNEATLHQCTIIISIGN